MRTRTMVVIAGSVIVGLGCGDNGNNNNNQIILTTDPDPLVAAHQFGVTTCPQPVGSIFLESDTGYSSGVNVSVEFDVPITFELDGVEAGPGEVLDVDLSVGKRTIDVAFLCRGFGVEGLSLALPIDVGFPDDADVRFHEAPLNVNGQFDVYIDPLDPGVPTSVTDPANDFSVGAGDPSLDLTGADTAIGEGGEPFIRVHTAGAWAPNVALYSWFINIRVNGGASSFSVTRQRHDGVDDTAATGIAMTDFRFVDLSDGTVFLFNPAALPSAPEAYLVSTGTLPTQSTPTIARDNLAAAPFGAAVALPR